ncbi:hypothetical protein MNB_SV-12-103 [hydrothermal vent metagenome]|uniref:DUF2059 domain-containing protein n=1 Tax=hydrothermal vent metagenome TaxID=652676 RepID=A0A1W1BGT8_9ZZZZ
MKKIILTSISIALLLGITTIHAEETKVPASTENVNHQAIIVAQEMLETIHMDTTYSKMINQMLTAQSAMLAEEITNDKKTMEGYTSFMQNFFNKYISWDLIKEDIAKLYAKNYTISELNDIKKFYLTPIGQKILKLKPQIMAESMKLTQSKILPHMDELQEEIVNFIKNTKEKEKK